MLLLVGLIMVFAFCVYGPVDLWWGWFVVGLLSLWFRCCLVWCLVGGCLLFCLTRWCFGFWDLFVACSFRGC